MGGEKKVARRWGGPPGREEECERGWGTAAGDGRELREEEEGGSFCQGAFKCAGGVTRTGGI